MSNDHHSVCYNYLQVKIVFRRKWFYHLITIFIQSILLLAVAYMTFYFRINNFQVCSSKDRVKNGYFRNVSERFKYLSGRVIL